MNRDDAVKVAAIVRDAGGEVIGRTRLQKITYLLWATGLEDQFSFNYKHFGPYSEGLAKAAHYADLFGLLTETEKQADWGGSYSIFTTHRDLSDAIVSPERLRLIKCAATAGAIELELAATALFLALEGNGSPWVETKRRKPEKSEGRLEGAKALYEQFRAITPKAMPKVAG